MKTKPLYFFFCFVFVIGRRMKVNTFRSRFVKSDAAKLLQFLQLVFFDECN